MSETHQGEEIARLLMVAAADDDGLSGGDGHLPHPDEVVGVAGEEGLAVGGPGHRQALRGVATGAAGDLRA